MPSLIHLEMTETMAELPEGEVAASAVRGATFRFSENHRLPWSEPLEIVINSQANDLGFFLDFLKESGPRLGRGTVLV